MHITSLQNNRIKNVVKLRQRRQRDKERVTIVEGVREIVRALQSGVIPLAAFVCPELILGAEAVAAYARLKHLAGTQSIQMFEISPEIFAKIAYRGESGGLILLVPYLKLSLADLSVKFSKEKKPVFLAIIQGVEKPGNLGAVLRTADAAGIDGVILARNEADSSTDLHNPNVIRASLGTVFTVPIVTESTPRVIDWLRQQEIGIVATTPGAVTPYTAVNLTQPLALVMGSEARGLGDDWLDAADEQVMIPMHGTVDSLNLSVATALLLYEAVRQRAE